MPITEKIRDLVYKSASSSEIKRTAREEGMRTLLEAGIEKAEEGITSLEEVLSAAYEA